MMRAAHDIEESQSPPRQALHGLSRYNPPAGHELGAIFLRKNP
jgi:hypothetical protein